MRVFLTVRHYLIITFGLIVLTACGSTPQPTSTPIKTVKKVIDEPLNEVPASPQEWLSEAAKRETNNETSGQVIQALLFAADGFLQMDEPLSAQQILYGLKSTIEDSEQQKYYQLLVALSYQNDNAVPPSALINLVNRPAIDQTIAWRQTQFLALINARMGNWQAAIQHHCALPTKQQDSNKLWQWVNQIGAEDLTQLSEEIPSISPYVSLRQLINLHGFDSQRFRQAIAQYGLVYQGHPLTTNWPREVEQAVLISPFPVQKIVVLLPLTGRFSTTGQSIKEGILAAYLKHLDEASINQSSEDIIELQFVDTNNVEAETLSTKTLEADWVIGPLLKSNVESLLPLLAPQSKVIALNRLDVLSQNNQLPGANNRTFFALAPEDEANQLAEDLHAKGFQTPIVVAGESTVYQRMQETFINRWQALSPQGSKNSLTQVSFSDNETLRDAVTSALDVFQSKARISQIQNLATEEVYNMPRSRRDIDAIVVFATPDQTELLNPVVEASVSPFIGKAIPVYATSRSLTYNKNKNQWRDLQHLHFVDIPWLLPDNEWQHLAQDMRAIRPNRTAALSRLFALGYDAFNLVDSVDYLNALPQLSVKGLTGTLYLNEQNQVIRVLPSAVVENEKVIVEGE